MRKGTALNAVTRAGTDRTPTSWHSSGGLSGPGVPTGVRLQPNGGTTASLTSGHPLLVAGQRLGDVVGLREIPEGIPVRFSPT